MKKLIVGSVVGAVLSAVFGTLLHFVYGWLGGGLWSVLGAVNESTWEHLKLVFWPLLFFGIWEYILYGRKIPGFISAKAKSIFVGMFVVVAGFYTYTGIWGRNALVLDIGLFLAAIGASYVFLYKRVNRQDEKFSVPFYSVCSAALIASAALLFIIFTYDTPRIALFQDPVTGLYGI